MTTKRIRVVRKDRKALKSEAIQNAVAERLDVELEEGEELTYEEVLRVILPNPSEDNILERPEEDMVFIMLDEMYNRSLELAGENVSVHRVVKHYLTQFIEENGLDPKEVYGNHE